MDIYDNPLTADRHPRLITWAQWFLAAGYSLTYVADLFDCDAHDLRMAVASHAD